jgi:predicted lipoprotein with Yx(FWY)xxD motif
MALAAATAGVLVLAGCGSSGSTTSTTSSAPSSGSSSSSAGAVVNTANNSDLGQTILVGANGQTLYNFEKDEPDESYCNGDCTKAWPPLTTTGAPRASGDVDQSKLGTLKRDDGTTQVTYDGHPLYYYAEDENPGEAKGNGSDEFGAEWYALQPNGKNAEESGGGSGSGDSS